MKNLKILTITILLMSAFIYYLNSFNSISVNGQIAFGEINKQTRDFFISFYDLKEKKKLREWISEKVLPEIYL